MDHFTYDCPSSQPYHHFMPVPSVASSHSGSEALSTSAPEPFKIHPHHLNRHFSPFNYDQGYNTNHSPAGNFPNHPSQDIFSVNSVQHQPRHGGVASTMKLGKLDSATSEDNDELSPAQSRRKAQNRTAQQAFRKRKEKHVKDLETKLADLEATQKETTAENERLKRDLTKVSTENKILRMRSVSSASTTSPGCSEFYFNILQNQPNKIPSRRITTSRDGERLLAAGAAWDFMLNHKLFKKGLVDVGSVSEYLKNCARSDGHGPVFRESSIIAAIEQSVVSRTDNLL
ncbi:AP-1-like transcription factor [Neonectria magnoliae]|uniref:AP-1-like transcription factor n=1 Tax=Neonectria magnoliae TaxID=2732573 RepID=A0ABR1IFI8_9HYPO